jgi:ABC-type transport system involved in cytochrome bd biosynthesis fused ATPase/permease subunit
MLILNEGTSVLDGDNEGMLDAVRALERKPTVLLVMHKLEVMRACDQSREVEESLRC